MAANEKNANQSWWDSISKRLFELKTDILLLRRIMKKGLEVATLSSLVLNASVVPASSQPATS